MKSKYEILKENIGKKVTSKCEEGSIYISMRSRKDSAIEILKDVDNGLVLIENKYGLKEYIDINHISRIYFPG